MYSDHRRFDWERVSVDATFLYGQVGARNLLFDEDTCATNFMIRDARMCALIAQNKEVRSLA